MEGGLEMSEALRGRLEAMKLTKEHLDEFKKTMKTELTVGCNKVVHKLQQMNIDVYLVSGGFHDLIEPLAIQLGIDPLTQVVANRFLFPDVTEPRYATFDGNELTCRNYGKALAIEKIIEEYAKKNTKDNKVIQKNFVKVIMIGDGVTDLEAKPPATAMIGYGGVVVRERVKKEADWFIESFQELLDLLDNL